MVTVWIGLTIVDSGVHNMTWWQAIILGIVQGLGEFLPISSSGHLVLFQNIFGLTGSHLLFDTLLHAGTLIAVFIALRQDIGPLFKKPFQKTTLLLIIATVPAVIATLAFGDFIETAFGGAYLGWGFLLTAAILLIAGRIKPAEQSEALNDMKYPQSVIMGIMQAVAILPGVSRSGSTICGGLAARANRDAVTRFSFLMSIPAILGSLVYQTKDILDLGRTGGDSGICILLGIVFAAVSGYIALRWMLRIVRTGKLWVFSFYVGLLGLLVLMDRFLLHIIF